MRRALTCAVVLGMTACGGTQTSPPADPVEPPRATISVRLSELPQDAGPSAEPIAPASAMHLVLIHQSGGREVRELGRVEGVCSHAPSGGRDLVVIRCWWAGVDSRVVVRRERAELLVVREVPGEDASELTRVPLDPRIRLTPLRPEL